MASFKKNALVRKVVPDVVGAVIDARLDSDLEKEYLVEFSDSEGKLQQRWFTESELIESEGDQ